MSILNFADSVMRNKIFNAKVENREYTIINLEHLVDIPQYGITARKDSYDFIVKIGKNEVCAQKHDTVIFDGNNELLAIIPLHMRATLFNIMRPEHETDWEVSMVDQECDGDIIHTKAVKRGHLFHSEIHMFDGNFIKDNHFITSDFRVRNNKTAYIWEYNKLTSNNENSEFPHITYGSSKNAVYCFVEDDEENYAMARIYVQVDYVGTAGCLHDGCCVVMPMQLANDLPELADYFAR